MTNKRIVLLAQAGESTNILFHAVHRQYPIERVIIESGESKVKFFKRRAKRLGWWTVLGQVAFMIYQRLFLRSVGHRRREEIKQQYELDGGVIPASLISEVSSCNSDTCRQLLRSLQADLVLVNGTRIISKKTISSADCPMLNLHAGITPKYRGVHGGYWALHNGEPELCGVSLHIIDEGIDTGTVLDQAVIAPEEKDSFTTYPLLQLAAGLKLLLAQLPAVLAGEIRPKPPLTKESLLWYHPTLWEYWRGGVA